MPNQGDPILAVLWRKRHKRSVCGMPNLEGMTQPLIVTQLLLERAEIEVQIKSLEDRLGQARADLLHVAATVRLFDPTAIDRPATVNHSATKAMLRAEVFALCKANLEAAVDPLDTRQLARHVITTDAGTATTPGSASRCRTRSGPQ